MTVFSRKITVFFGFLLSLFLLVPIGVFSQELLKTEPQKDVDESKVELPIEVDPNVVSSFNQLTLIYPDTELPVILPRSIWESDETLVKLLTWLPEIDHEPPDYHPVSRIIVHDLGCPATSLTCNSDTIDPRKVIQSVYRFHAVTRGWGDIGYNYIIDRKGRIYEGRYGGNGVRAAHLYYDAKCDNFNPGSVGILLLGRYDTTPMPEVMQKSLARLASWISITNNLDLESQSVTSEVWHNPKLNDTSSVPTTCDITQGSFNSSFTGPVLLSHGDIETGNSDKFDLSSIRTNAIALLKSVPTYVYNTKEEPTKTFAIKEGFREAYVPPPPPTPDSSSSGTTLPDSLLPTSTPETLPTSTTPIDSSIPSTPPAPTVLAVNKNQLYSFPPKTSVSFAENTLLKSDTRSRIYVIEKGKRRLIASKTIFDKYGFRWENVKTVFDRELAGAPLGLPLTFPDGSLLGETNGDVYVVKEGALRHISSAALFASFNFTWKGIIPVTKEEIKVHKIGDPLIFTDGTLMKGPEPRVYLVENKKRRPIGSAELFNRLKLKWNGIKVMQRFELDRYPLGTFVFWPSGTLIRSTNDPKVYLVEGGKKRWITSAEEFNARNYSWKNIIAISDTELTDYSDGDTIGVVVAPTPPEPLPQTDPIPTSTPELIETPPETESTPPPSEEPSVTPPPEAQNQNPPQNLAKGPQMRIAIYNFSLGKSFGIRANTPYGVYTADGLRVSHGANEATTLVPEKTSESYRFQSDDPEAIFELLSYEDRPSWNTSLNDNFFRGAIEVKYSTVSGRFWVVNELPMEEYVKGVSEAGNSDTLEHLKVFTVASRSYATYHLNRGGKHPGEPFHLKNTPNDQVYKGYGFEKRAPNWIGAVNATNGEIGTYGGNVIVAAYSSGAPGPTKSACDLWGGKFCEPAYDYLDGGITDPEGTVYTYATCSGANHCVGIDAAGARRLAVLGKTYSDILKYYYFGVELKKSY